MRNQGDYVRAGCSAFALCSNLLAQAILLGLRFFDEIQEITIDFLKRFTNFYGCGLENFASHVHLVNASFCYSVMKLSFYSDCVVREEKSMDVKAEGNGSVP